MCHLMGSYLKHVRVFIMAVLHNHSLVPGQRVGDAVLAFEAYRLKCDKCIFRNRASYGDTTSNETNAHQQQPMSYYAVST